MAKSVRLSVISPTQSFTFDSVNQFTKIGRSFKCDFNIPREDFSREHCLFEALDGEYYLTDLGSKNGILVNRSRLVPHERVKVKSDSLIILSNVYQLKINAIEIKPQSSVVLKLPDPDLQTVTYNLSVEEKVEVSKKRLPRKNDEVTEKGESLKMTAGFVAVVGLFLIYQALG